MPTLRIRLFGPEVDFEGDGVERLVTMRPLARRLLARLAVAEPGEHFDTDALAKLLVIGAEPAADVSDEALRSARHQLRNAQTDLRRRLGHRNASCHLLGFRRRWIALRDIWSTMESSSTPSITATWTARATSPAADPFCIASTTIGPPRRVGGARAANAARRPRYVRTRFVRTRAHRDASGRLRVRGGAGRRAGPRDVRGAPRRGPPCAGRRRRPACGRRPRGRPGHLARTGAR